MRRFCFREPLMSRPSHQSPTKADESSNELSKLTHTLRTSERRMQAILDTAVDAIVTIDLSGIIRHVNHATERLFGYTESELIGQNVSMLMPAPYSAEHDGYLQHYLETREARIIGSGREVEAKRKDGTTFPVDLAVSEVTELGLFTGILRDITDRHAERRRLMESERLAALGQAMTGLTHESRNALARSQSNLRMLARRLQDRPELLELIRGALQANDAIRRQFEEVREYAAPIHLHLEQLSLRNLIESVWENLAGERENHIAELRFANDASCDICEVDTFHVQNAFRNIFENSLAACTDPVEILVTISDDELDRRPALRVSIRDNGPGLPVEIVGKIFDAFFTTKARGTGLGLAIVRRSIEAHNGRVEGRSGDTNGAEITLILPRTRRDDLTENHHCR